MHNESGRSLSRLLGFILAGALLVALWNYLPLLESWFAPGEPATPRVVTARGDLVLREGARTEVAVTLQPGV